MRAQLTVLSVALAVVLVGGHPARAAADTSDSLTGRIVVRTSALAQSADGTQRGPALSLYLDVSGDMVAAQVDPDTAVVSPDGQRLALTVLRPGDWVQVEGVWEAAGRFRVSRVVQLSD